MNILSNKLACYPVLFAALLVTPLPARAGGADTFTLGAGATLSRDSNLYRTGGDDPLGVQADTITDVYAIATFDKTISRQNISASFQLDKIRFNHNPDLNYAAQRLAARWQADLPGEARFGVGVTRNVTLAKFSDTRIFRKNVITREAMDADADVPVMPDWHVLGFAHLERRRDSDALQEANSMDGGTVGAGVSYSRLYGNHVDFIYRSGHTRYINRPFSWFGGDNALHEQSAEVRAGWSLSSMNRFEGDITYLSRNNDHLEVHNFSGFNFRLSHVWSPAATFTMTSTLSRNIGAAGDNNFNYAVSHAARVEPAWQLAPKVKLSAMAEWNERQYQGDLSRELLIGQYGAERGEALYQYYLQNGFVAQARDDKTVLAGLSLLYTPYRWGQITIAYNFERRNSNVALQSYVDRVLSLTLQTQF